MHRRDLLGVWVLSCLESKSSFYRNGFNTNIQDLNNTKSNYEGFTNKKRNKVGVRVEADKTENVYFVRGKY